MPVIGTRGGMSARGFGLFGFRQSFIQGSYGLFEVSSTNGTTMKYAWAPETTGAGRSLLPLPAPQGSSVAGNSVMAVFAKNLNSSGAHQDTVKYVHSGDVVSAGALLTNGCYYGFASGNSTVGLFYAGGFDSSTPKLQTTLYNYSANTCSAGGSLVYSPLQGCAVGNATISIANRAGRQASPSAANDSYTYATNTSATATAFPVAHGYGNRYWNNADVGILQGISGNGNATQKYRFADNTTAAAGTISQASAGNQGCGIDTFAIAPGDTVGATIKYLYATDTTAVGQAFSAVPFLGGATNNGLAGVNA